MPSIRISPRAAVAAGVTALALAAPAGAYALTVDPTVGTATNVAIRTTGPGTVAVSWAATSILGVVDWEIVVTETSADGTSSHGYFQAAGARSLTVPGLPAGAKVHAVIGTFGGSRLLNLSATTPDVTVPAGLCAGVTGACVAADGNQNQGAEQHVAQGFLHGLGLTATGVKEMQALQPTSWRIGEGYAGEMSGLQAFHATSTAALSDAWYAATYNPQTHAVLSPWENWPGYTWFVQSEVRKRIADGNLPAYWDIQNEPDLSLNYDPASPPTAALVEQQFNVAYTAIKGLLPDAKVIGPSFGGFNLVGDATHLGVLDFINYATDNNLQFAAISWHENNAGNAALPSFQLPLFADHVQMVRTALNASPVLAGTKIFLNEVESAATTRVAGWDLGHVIAFEQAGVDQVQRACYGDCVNGADGLLDPTDKQTPRMTYWGRLAYAQMTGNRVLTTSTQRDTTAMTSVDATAKRATTIIARHHGCSVGGNTDCPTGSFVTPADSGALTLALKLPSSAAGRHATVSVTTLGATVANTPSQPAATVTTVKVPGNAQTKLALSSLADGAAYVVTVTWS